MLVGKLGWAAFRSEDQARKRSATHMAPRSQATSGGVKGADERVLSAQGSGTRPTTFIGNLQGQPTTRPAKKQAKQTRESKRLPAPAIASRSCVRSCWAIAGAISPQGCRSQRTKAPRACSYARLLIRSPRAFSPALDIM
jgi:hypothetical protein